MTEATQIEPGDRIRFRAATRWSEAAVWRKVVGMDGDSPLVRFGGYSEFLVHPHEVIEVQKAPAATVN